MPRKAKKKPSKFSPTTPKYVLNEIVGQIGARLDRYGQISDKERTFLVEYQKSISKAERLEEARQEHLKEANTQDLEAALKAVRERRAKEEG